MDFSDVMLDSEDFVWFHCIKCEFNVAVDICEIMSTSLEDVGDIKEWKIFGELGEEDYPRHGSNCKTSNPEYSDWDCNDCVDEKKKQRLIENLSEIELLAKINSVIHDNFKSHSYPQVYEKIRELGIDIKKYDSVIKEEYTKLL